MLDAVLNAPPERREALLVELCGSDVSRRDVLRQLVAECERSDPLLDRPAGEHFATLFEDDPVAVPVPATLGDRYRIVREAGRGGMAVVYLAKDLRHDRDVAVKVVRPDIAVALGRTRFLQEIGIAARLRHPHIVPLFDSGETDGLLYYVMPFEPGASLRERLTRDGRLPVAEAVRVLRDVTSALAHAHRQGIVHRDIKPENVLLSEEHAMVTDFGVAKALADAAGPGSAGTAAGVTFGTPAYMAPEQIGADPAVDHRADVYALGALAYELLSGRLPFEAGAPHEVLQAHLSRAPAPLAAVGVAVPESLSAVVMKCLAKRPGDRWQSAEEILSHLDPVAPLGDGAAGPRKPPRSRARVAGVLAGALVLALVSWLALRPGVPAGSPEGTPRKLFIVADFTNQTADASLGPLIAEVIGDALAGSPLLTLVGRERIAATRRRMRLGPDGPLTPAAAAEIAVREEIAMVVDGAIRPAGTGLALSARIVEAASGNVIHAATATARDSTELVAAIDRLSEGLRRGLGESVASVQAPAGPLWSYTTRSLAALQKHQASIRARSAGDFLRAIELGREAVALDPDFANVQLAIASNRVFAGLPVGPVVPGLQRALRLRDSLSDRERDAVDAFYHLYVTGDVDKSIAAFRRHLESLRQFPGERGFTSELALVLALSGDFAGAQRVVEEANALYGGVATTTNQAILARILHATGHSTDAARVIGEVLTGSPDNPRFLTLRLAVLTDSGQYETAHGRAALIRREASLINDLRIQAELDAVRGRFAEATGHLRELLEQAMALGEHGAALEIAAAAGRLQHLAGATTTDEDLAPLLARRRVDSLAPVSRPYLPLALFYATTNRPRQAREWLARYARELPVGLRGPDRWMLHRTEAALHLAEGNPQAALDAFRDASRATPLRIGLFEEPFVPRADHPELARVYRALGQPDSAVAVYQRFLAVRSMSRLTADAFERGAALEALGGLYDELGDRERAAATFRQFADLWRDADASLQPRVAAARRRGGSR